MKSMVKVLLTGISGFAGSHVLEHLLVNTDWHIIGIASWKHKGTPERIEEVLKGNPDWKNRVEIITHDLVAPLPERTKQRISHCDYILNLAAESHVDRSIEEPVPFVKNNVDLALNVLEFAREYTPKVFLQFSTDEVYGVAPEGVNHPEWAPIVPSNPYSASKACQEAIAISYWRTYGIPLILTNTMNLFGETQDSEKYMAKAIKQISNGEAVTVHGTSEKIGSRYYLHARNMADAVLHILKDLPPTPYSEDKDLFPDRYNIVGDVELNNLEVVQKISEVLGKDLKYEFVDFHATRPGHDRRYALDGTKLKKLGWAAPLEFMPSLKKYVDWTLSHKLWL
jgi:dTDP-glucose 4,6-dehydratase